MSCQRGTTHPCGCWSPPAPEGFPHILTRDPALPGAQFQGCPADSAWVTPGTVPWPYRNGSRALCPDHPRSAAGQSPPETTAGPANPGPLGRAPPTFPRPNPDPLFQSGPAPPVPDPTNPGLLFQSGPTAALLSGPAALVPRRPRSRRSAEQQESRPRCRSPGRAGGAPQRGRSRVPVQPPEPGSTGDPSGPAPPRPPGPEQGERAGWGSPCPQRRRDSGRRGERGGGGRDRIERTGRDWVDRRRDAEGR